jgi:hypothetical protein
VDQFSLRNNDNIKARCKLIATEDLSNQSFSSIPHHRTTQLSGGCYA